LAEDGHELALGNTDRTDAKLVDGEFMAVGADEREFFGRKGLAKRPDCH
jgi:hypothetical protein